MKRTIRNYAIRILIMVVLAAVIVLIARAVRPSFADSTEQRAGDEITERHDLILWYYDESLTDYVTLIKNEYFKNTGLRIDCRYVSAVAFFENINTLNNAKGETPDIYITETSRLEEAYLGGTARVNADTETYSLRNYSRNALSSVIYDGRMVAYPLCFDTAFFVYNRKLIDKAPESFAEIESLSASFVKDAESDLDMVMLYSVEDVLSNYPFIGAYLELGGVNGDNADIFNVYSEDLLEAAYFYQELSANLNIDMNTMTYDLAENSFAFGRSQMAILNCRSIAALNKAGTDYVICDMPKLNDKLDTKTLSANWCVCVNPGCADPNLAAELAKFMTYDKADLIYDATGYMSCARLSYREKGLADVYAQYELSGNLPKLIETEEMWKDLKTLLNNIWNGGEVTSELSTFQSGVHDILMFRNEGKKNKN
ncbi:MAG: extracellular solute-binding protein [Lachnospiraceae bacterium]|nr:extracellular solute-binding protein [Lachnospiraceae bacterium]